MRIVAEKFGSVGESPDAKKVLDETRVTYVTGLLFAAFKKHPNVADKVDLRTAVLTALQLFPKSESRQSLPKAVLARAEQALKLK